MASVVPLRLVLTLLRNAPYAFASPSEFMGLVFPKLNRIWDGGRQAARRPSDRREDRF
jgi:hypothetical protein